MLLPILASVSNSLGINPLIIMISATIAALSWISSDFTEIDLTFLQLLMLHTKLGRKER